MDFTEFYEALYSEQGATGRRRPFPWQTRLAARVIEHGWYADPENLDRGSIVIDLPTASGKTTVLDIALFHLIDQLDSHVERTAALRLFLIVDRRIVVDGAFQHARQLANKLATATDGPLKRAKDLLCEQFKVERPVHVSIMRGGLFRDDGWTRSPVQPTICVSTVDQVGSRLLFRGYGVSPSMRPIHAGLVANDSLLLIDEAHLSEPFLQTLDRVRHLTREPRESSLPRRPLQFVRMSATNAESDGEPFEIDDDDRRHPVLRLRLEAKKKATFDKVQVDKEDSEKADLQFCGAIVSHALRLAGLESTSEESGSPKRRRGKKPPPESSQPVRVIGVVVNRVRAARQIHQVLCASLCPDGQEPKADVILLTGRIRPFDRDELLFRTPLHGRRGWLSWIAADRKQDPDRPVFVVATQTVEVGADISFDAMVTEAAPLDCLRQRFGRLDRLGHRRQSEAVIVARSNAVAKTADDPIYGRAIGETWAWLNSKDVAAGSGRSKWVDFGLNAMERHLRKFGPASSQQLRDLLAPRDSAPFLQTPYAEIWSRTNPAPAADPDVARFLHGNESRPPDVQVVWRADLLNHRERVLMRDHVADYINTVALLPPTRMETCSVPVGELRRLLSRSDGATDSAAKMSADLADVEGGSLGDAADDQSPRKAFRLALLWRGEKTRPRTGTPIQGTPGEGVSKLLGADDIRPGDTVIIPTCYGGCDEFGWNPASVREVPDVAECCVRWSRGRPVLRVHPAVLAGWSPANPPLPESDSDEALGKFLDELAQVEGLPVAVAATVNDLRIPGTRCHRIPYELEDEGSVAESLFPMLLIARQRLGIDLVLRESQDTAEDITGLDDMLDEDDARSFSGSSEPAMLTAHTDGVRSVAERFAKCSGFPDPIVADIKRAAEWHDLGKIDPRFQTMLHGGDELKAIIALSEGRLLAKSEIPSNDRAARQRAKSRAGLPDDFRHEALSVLLLRYGGRTALQSAMDRELVEFLIGSHHGFGRPFFPVCFDHAPPDVAASWRSRWWQLPPDSRTIHELFRVDSDWSDLVAALNQRYGLWGLAWLEAVFRLADHTQSAREAIGETASVGEVTANA